MNLALLGKWHRRFASLSPSLWKTIISEKYGLSMVHSCACWIIWLWLVEKTEGYLCSTFSVLLPENLWVTVTESPFGMTFVLLVQLWHSLLLAFFKTATNKEGMESDLVCRSNNGNSWNLHMRRGVKDWEMEQYSSLADVLHKVTLVPVLALYSGELILTVYTL